MKNKIKLFALSFVSFLISINISGQFCNPIMPEISIIEGDTENHLFFPDIAKLPNGDLGMVYYENSAHVNTTGGKIYFIKSADNGLNWSTPQLIVDYTNLDGMDSRDPNISVLNNGEIIITFFTGKWGGSSFVPTTYQSHISEVRVMKCTYSESLNCNEPSVISTNKTGNYTSGPVLQLDNGNLLLPTYGTIPGNPYRTFVNISTDNGSTWGEEIGISDHGDEMAFGQIGNDVFAVIRPNGRICKSSDNGYSWSIFSDEIHLMHAPHLLKIDEENLFLSFCSYSYPQSNTSRAVFGKIFNPNLDWDASPMKTIYTSSCTNVWDMGYPSSVIADDNDILTVYYDNACANLLGGAYSKYQDWGIGTYDFINFNSENLGTVPTDFILNSGTAQISNSHSYSSEKSLKIWDNSTTSISNISRNFDPDTSKTIEFKIFPVSNTQAITFGLNYEGSQNTNAVFHFLINENGTLFWYDGISWIQGLNDAGNIIQGTWNDIKIYADCKGEAQIFLNNAYAGTAGVWHELNNMDTLRFMSSSTVGVGVEYYIDDIKIYEDPEFLEIEEVELFDTSFSIYPNPTTDILNIDQEANNPIKIRIVDLNGKSLKTSYFNEIHNEMDLSDLSIGIYILNIVQKNGEVESFKILKK